MLSSRSLKNLMGVHPDLERVIRRADEMCDKSGHPFTIIEGVRTIERQKMLVSKGLSKTMHSRHLTGHAVDFVPLIEGEVTWKTQAFLPVIDAFKDAGRELNVAIESGHDWVSFKDTDHVQLSWKAYP